MAAKFDFIIKQGSTFHLDFQVLDGTGSPRNFTGYTIRSQMRPEHTSATFVNLTATFTDAANGRCRIALTAVQTADLTPGCWVYDIEVVLDEVVDRVFEGEITVTPEVTRDG